MHNTILISDASTNRSIAPRMNSCCLISQAKGTLGHALRKADRIIATLLEFPSPVPLRPHMGISFTKPSRKTVSRRRPAQSFT